MSYFTYICFVEKLKIILPFCWLQAFASSLTGSLATSAVLRGVGVGSEVLLDA